MSTSRGPEPGADGPDPEEGGSSPQAAGPSPEAADPEVAGSEAADPEVAGSEAADPEVAGSEPADPEVAGSEPADPEVAGSEAADPEVAGSEGGPSQPEAGQAGLGSEGPEPFEGAGEDPGGRPPGWSGRTAGNRREPGGWLSRVRSVARPQEIDESEPVNPVSDEDLVRALYAEHAAPLLRYALRMTDGDRQRAEDIVQETLLRAWMHPEAIADRPARPWLFAVARNLAVDAHRARKARPHEVGESALSLVAVPDEADRVLESWAVADALGALRPDHRRVLLETYYRGRSVAEAATVLGIPAGTVKSRAFYALRALKLALEERGLAP
jgi:RNA polymerase sigma-70 factor, ECF subfamily